MREAYVLMLDKNRDAEFMEELAARGYPPRRTSGSFTHSGPAQQKPQVKVRRPKRPKRVISVNGQSTLELLQHLVNGRKLVPMKWLENRWCSEKDTVTGWGFSPNGYNIMIKRLENAAYIAPDGDNWEIDQPRFGRLTDKQLQEDLDKQGIFQRNRRLKQKQ